jgi:hypothetical protein
LLALVWRLVCYPFLEPETDPLIYALAAIQLVINAVAPPDAMGTLNGLTLAFMAALRAICPAVFSSFFAFGVGHQILWGQVIFVPLILLGIILRISLIWMPSQVDAKDKEGKPVAISPSPDSDTTAVEA